MNNYYQVICRKYHYFEIDARSVIDPSKIKCPICSETPIWYNLVNIEESKVIISSNILKSGKLPKEGTINE